ncbi:CRE-CLEC-197 protein [Caenorhabditis remanei]|uniref:CRE-CLEC-197 protein n=1 Tax=Caenorhabditis remanei TaxID=31234 RepID=E3MK39_CAERE|nr:CRE-CLEC-197 protein [Caenorhabditis remanei]
MIRSILILSVVFVAIQAMMAPCIDKPVCPDGWKKFEDRTNGQWCMKVFPGNMTWWEAERECRCTTKGAHLSGIESSSEKQWVEGQGQEVLDKIQDKNGAIWIGAYRRKECPSGATSSDVNCHAEKLFQFTDQHTCKTFIFQNWADNQPTNNAGDDCGAILVSTESSGDNVDASGKTVAKNCLQTTGTTPIMTSVGYVCGVKPAYPGNDYGGGYNTGYGGGDGGYGFGGGEMVVIGAGKPEKKKN